MRLVRPRQLMNLIFMNTKMQAQNQTKDDMFNDRNGISHGNLKSAHFVYSRFAITRPAITTNKTTHSDDDVTHNMIK